MLIRQVRLYPKCQIVDVSVQNGRIARIGTNLASNPLEEVFDFAGALMLSPFMEPHMHLDATQTAGEPRWNTQGTLFEGIQIWAERKTSLTLEDVKARALKTLTWQASHGIQAVRTHVDVTDEHLVALEALLALKEEVKDWMDIQIVAFPQDGILSSACGKRNLERALEMGADVVGAIPHFEFTRELGIESLHEAFRLAKRFDKPLDVHCDETDDDQSRCLETLAYLALKTGWGSRVVASHTTAMHSYNGAYTSKLMRLLKLSQIQLVANPLVNTHLQGRFDHYPVRRGLTRVKALCEAGINVAFGHDDIRDPWYPLGAGNPYEVLKMGLHVGHMLGSDDLMRAFDFVTVNAARTMGLPSTTLKEGEVASFVIVDAQDPIEAIRRNATVLLSVRKGCVVAKTVPAHTWVYQPHEVRVMDAH